ncbi:hypothetical protein OAB54_07530 [Flavobacteriaceae bacterium]|nr:hypothetical protein [Flavobacteriaceae bacterium]
MKKLFLLLLFITQITFGQSNIIEISTTGSGETKEEAVQNALLSALKQSFGVFISSNTEIINDVLTKDKISELSSGNILEYNIVSEIENGDYHNVLVSSKISMNTLASYTRNKVDSNEISGDVFVSNFLIKELNKENELQSVKDLIEYSKKVLPTTLDFYINSSEPISNEDTNTFYTTMAGGPGSGYTEVYDGRSPDGDKLKEFDFYIPSLIGFKPNQKYISWKSHFNLTITNISLTPEDYIDYKIKGITLYPIFFNNELIFLRNIETISSLYQYFVEATKTTAFNFILYFKGNEKSYDFSKKTYDDLRSPKFLNDGFLLAGRSKYVTIKDGHILPQQRLIDYFGYPNYGGERGPNDIFALTSNTTIEMLLEANISGGRYEGFPLFHNSVYWSYTRWNLQPGTSGYDKEFSGKIKGEFKGFMNIFNLILLEERKRDLEKRKLRLSSRMIKGSPKWANNKYTNPKLPRKYKEYLELFNEKVNQESLKMEISFPGRKPFSISINTDYVQFAGAHTVYSFFTLEELKKFRGFKINNSN